MSVSSSAHACRTMASLGLLHTASATLTRFSALLRTIPLSAPVRPLIFSAVSGVTSGGGVVGAPAPPSEEASGSGFAGVPSGLLSNMFASLSRRSFISILAVQVASGATGPTCSGSL